MPIPDRVPDLYGTGRPPMLTGDAIAWACAHAAYARDRATDAQNAANACRGDVASVHASVNEARDAARAAQVEATIVADHVQSLRDKVDLLVTGGVDYDLLAIKVADLLAERMAN